MNAGLGRSRAVERIELWVAALIGVDILSSEPARQFRDDRVPRSQPDPQGAASRLTEERRLIAWVGKSVVFTGNLTSLEDMTIDGRVEGTIEVRDHDLTIGPDADIQANISARIVTVLGAVTGGITATTRVEIHETGAVNGDITSPRLVIADGAKFQGRADTGRAKT
jgi:cytoskeletal protein CcmA (bactofilin family)